MEKPVVNGGRLFEVRNLLSSSADVLNWDTLREEEDL